MNWSELISNMRLGQEVRHPTRYDDRSEFKRDYDRLIFSSPFRRLQNKTQVFPLPGSVFVHNRLTHSLEVASVGQSLGNDVARILTERHPVLKGGLFEEIGTITATACLAHDMGNPPFGHSGERAIRSFFTEGEGASLEAELPRKLWADITHFEGNANAFRLLTHRFNGRREGGFVMTYTTLASIVKYPYSSLAAPPDGKFGFFSEEEHLYERIADKLGIRRLSFREEPAVYSRHPLVYLVEAADDICYEIMDLEDAYKLKILSYEEAVSLLMNFFDEEARDRMRRRIEEEGISDTNEQVGYLRARVIGRLTNLCTEAFVENEEAILRGDSVPALIKLIPETERKAYAELSSVSRTKIYKSKPVLDIELSGYKIMETLMEQMTAAAVHPDRFYSQQLISRVSSQYDIRAKDLGTRILAVLDYISGMTDVYALDVYQKISGISLPIV
ncbi:MAG: dNTP triphosphohydrolase [Prevotella sp.]|nr:dNTP triphosphohydrolase [Prevotella sp.]